MSKNDLSSLEIITKVIEKRLLITQAAQILGLSIRQKLISGKKLSCTELVGKS